MYLQHLENYIVKLGIDRVSNNSSAFLDADVVIGDLMNILLEEESLIPDFVVSGDSPQDPDGYLESYRDFFVDYSDEEQIQEMGDSMKKMMWLMLAASFGLIGFLFGFFTAP